MSLFLSKDTPLVAVDIGSHSIKMAQLAKGKKQLELVHFGIMPLGEECLVDGLVKKNDDVIEAITNLLRAEKIATRHAVASVAGEAVIIKRIQVPLQTRDELKESINEEAEQYIPFDIDDVSIDFQILGRVESGTPPPPVEEEKKDEEAAGEEGEGEKMEILLVAVQRDLIDNRMMVLEGAGLKPVILDLDVFALVNAVNLTIDVRGLGPVALIDLGDSFTHLNILSGGVSAFSRDIPVGGNQCTNRLMKKFQVPFRQIPELKMGNLPAGVDSRDVIEVLTGAFDKVIEEIQKSLEFFRNTNKTEVGKIFLTGGGALIPGTDRLLAQKLSVPVEIVDPLKGIKVNPKMFDPEIMELLGPSSAQALGLATRRFDYQ